MKSMLLLTAIATLITANYALADRQGDVVSNSQNAVKELGVLITGVDECFNPVPPLFAPKDYIAQAKKRLSDTKAVFEGYVKNPASADPKQVAAIQAGFKKDRSNLELGFEGNDDLKSDGTQKYPKCRSVKGDKRANSQSIALKNLLDVSLPGVQSALQ